MPLYKNQASQKIAVYAYDPTTAAGTDPSKTGNAASITAQISKDGATSAATNDVNPTELDATDHPGVYIFDLTTAETNADLINISAVSATANILLDTVQVLTTPGTNSAVAASVAGSVGSVTGAVGSVTGAVGSVTGAVGSVTGHTAQTGDTYALANGASGFVAIAGNVTTLLGRIPAALFSGITSLAEWLGLMAGKQAADATALTEIKATGAGSGTYDETTDSNEAIADAGGGGAPTAAQVADAVWDEDQADHVAAGTFGVIATEIAAIPTTAMRGTDGANTVVPDAAGTAPTAIEIRAEMDSNSTQLAAIAADTTTNIPALIAALNNLSQANIRTAVGLASADLDTQLAAVATSTGTTIPALIAALNDPTAAAIASAAWAEVLEGALTAKGMMRVMLAASSGVLSGAEGLNVKVRDLADAKDRIDATVDANGNRTAVTLDITD